MKTLLSLALLPLLLVSCASTPSSAFRSEVHVWPHQAAQQPQTAETRLALSKSQDSPSTTTVHATFVDVHNRVPQRLSATVPGNLSNMKTDWVSSDHVRLIDPSGVVLEFRRNGNNKWSAFKA